MGSVLWGCPVNTCKFSALGAIKSDLHNGVLVLFLIPFVSEDPVDTSTNQVGSPKLHCETWRLPVCPTVSHRTSWTDVPTERVLVGAGLPPHPGKPKLRGDDKRQAWDSRCPPSARAAPRLCSGSCGAGERGAGHRAPQRPSCGPGHRAGTEAEGTHVSMKLTVPWERHTAANHGRDYARA